MRRTIQSLVIILSLPLLLGASTPAPQTYTVTKVIDGDTLKLSNGETVRLIGIDTPESRKNSKALDDSQRTNQDIETITSMGKKATQFVKKLVNGSKEVRIEYDVQKKDRYGRTLAYVYIKWPLRYPIDPPDFYINSVDGELFLNATIVQAGYAQPMTIPPNVKYVDLFKKLYEYARENKRGLWR